MSSETILYRELENIHAYGDPAFRRRMNLKELWTLIKDTFAQWSEDNPFQLAAALAYYTLFSMAPVLMIAIAVAGLVFGREASQNQVLAIIEDLVGAQGARAIRAMIETAGQKPDSGVFAAGVGTILFLLGAAGVVEQLQHSLNAIWRVAPKTGRGIRGFLLDRLLSFSMVLSVGFLLVVSLVISAVLTAVTGIVGGFLSIDAAAAHILGLVVSVTFISLVFAVIYKFVPDVRIAWRDVWIGAAIASLLFSGGKFLIGFYLGHSAVTSIYGAAGSLVTLLLWVYYSSLMFFFGAELTQVYATRYGSRVVSSEKTGTLRMAAELQKREVFSSPQERREQKPWCADDAAAQRPTAASPDYTEYSQSVGADDSLATKSKNVTMIAVDGAVTLNGPVKREKEE